MEKAATRRSPAQDPRALAKLVKFEYTDRTVPDYSRRLLQYVAKCAAVCGPISKIMSSSSTSDNRLDFSAADSENSLPQTTSTGPGYPALRLRLFDQALCLGNQISFDQRFADIVTRRSDKGIGNPAAGNQLIDDVRKRFQHGQLGRHLGAANDGNHG